MVFQNKKEKNKAFRFLIVLNEISYSGFLNTNNVYKQSDGAIQLKGPRNAPAANQTLFLVKVPVIN